MARPKRHNADYHSHDANMRNDPRIKAVRNRFSHTGYAVWNYLLETLTSTDYFKLEWSEINIEILAGDFDVTTDDLKDIVDYFLKLNLVQQDGVFLLCKKHIDNFSGLITKRESRANKVVSDSRNPEAESIGEPKPQAHNVSGGQNPQSKVKERKVKESIVNIIKNYTLSSECEDFKISDEERKEIYFHFSSWINANSPRVNEMKESFTQDQAIKLMIDFRGDFIESLLKTMHSEELLAGKIGSDIIFRDWAKRRNVEPAPQTTDIKTTLWRKCIKEIEQQISPEEFAKWFKPLSIIKYDGTEIHVGMPDIKHGKHIEENYLEVYKSSLHLAFGDSFKLKYFIAK